MAATAATQSPTMIDLYYWPTPNGWKVTIMLEECGLPYKIVPVNIGIGQQFEPAFLEISPNNRMPAIVDHEPHGATAGAEPVSIFESGAILMYLAEKSDRFMPTDVAGRYEVVQWVMWQMGNLGPMAGQAHHFRNYCPDKIDYAIDRYTDEVNRLYGVMDSRLSDRAYLAGDYSIADMAAWPWVVPWKRQGQDLDAFPNLRRWFDTLRARPAVTRGFEAAKELREANAGREEEARKVLFGQRARPRNPS